MAGTIDSTIERKRDQKEERDAKKVADSGGPGEGDSSADRTPDVRRGEEKQERARH